MSVCLRLKMWTRCLISPLFALFMSFHTILLFLEAYQIVHVLGQTHILTLKLTHLPIIPTSLFYHSPPLVSSSLVSSPPSFQARELTRVPSLMNNIDKVGFLKQTKTHLQPTYLEILILEYDTVLDRVSLYSWIKDKTGFQQNVRRLVCFKGAYHTLIDVYLLTRLLLYSIFTNYRHIWQVMHAIIIIQFFFRLPMLMRNNTHKYIFPPVMGKLFWFSKLLS